MDDEEKEAAAGGEEKRDDGGRGEEEEEVSVEDKEVDVIGIEKKQMIVDVLVLPCRCYA